MLYNFLEHLDTYDHQVLNDTFNRLDVACSKLLKFERKYNIRNFKESLNLRLIRNRRDREEVRRVWAEIQKISDELDYLFPED